MEVNPRKSFLLFSESAKYPGQVDVLWGRKLRDRKRGRRKKREEKHVTLIISLPGAPILSFRLSLSHVPVGGHAGV